MKKTRNPIFLILKKKKENGFSRNFKNKNFNHGYIYNQDIMYSIIKFCKLAANKGYVILLTSFTRKIKKTQKIKIKTKCQNFAIKQIVT